MHEIDDEHLANLSSQELLELKARIHDAIRAQIRKKNDQRAAAARQPSTPANSLPQVEESRQRSLAVHSRLGQVTSAAPFAGPPRGTGPQPHVTEGALSLERERDAWLARKRRGPG